jgi:hypothetical protein
MSCERAFGKLAQQVVNNFAANRAAPVSDWPLGFISVSVRTGFPAGGPGLLTTSRFNDFQLCRPARRAGLDPLTTTQEGVCVLHDDFSILPSPGQAVCGRPSQKTNIMDTPHPYDLVIGLDRSDKKADLHLITTTTGQRRSVNSVFLTPHQPVFVIESLYRWNQSIHQVNGGELENGLCLYALVAWRQRTKFLSSPSCRQRISVPLSRELHNCRRLAQENPCAIC